MQDLNAIKRYKQGEMQRDMGGGCVRRGTEREREDENVIKKTMDGILKVCGQGSGEHDVLEEPSLGVALGSSSDDLCDLGHMI